VPLASVTSTGSYKKFVSTCVVYNDPKMGPFKGIFTFNAAGSGSFTSDIDMQVIFDRVDNNQEPINIYNRILVITSFIQKFNALAPMAGYLASSTLEALDVNLYVSDFGNPDLAAQVFTLDADDYRVFTIMNRLSVMMLIINDSYHALMQSFPQINNSVGDKYANRMQQLVENTTKSYNKVLSTVYGEYLLQYENSKVGDYTHYRKENNALRNNAMQNHSFLAAQIGLINRLPALCHSIASNYFAMEAYVPVGAIFDIFRLQGRDVQVNGQNVPMNGNYFIDSLHQNFAYAIEHYFYFKAKATQQTANKYFAKYVSRIWEVVPKLAPYSEKMEKCWRTACSLLQFPSNEDIAGLAKVKALTSSYAAVLNESGNVNDIVHYFGLYVYVKCIRYPFELFWAQNDNVMYLYPLQNEIKNIFNKVDDMDPGALGDQPVLQNASKNLRRASI